MPWTDDYAREYGTWRYPQPYDFYNGEFARLEDPERYRAILDDGDALAAHWYFEIHDDVVEIGIGLRPDLVGRGLGRAYLEAELDYARAEWRPARFRLFVAEWNDRARRLYERLGFVEVGDRYERTFDQLGTHTFLTMERPA